MRGMDMTLRRMDNVLIVVDDLGAAKAFFVELSMELEDEMPIERRWVDLVVGLENVSMRDRDDADPERPRFGSS
jgi:hypothetical protein